MFGRAILFAVGSQVIGGKPIVRRASYSTFDSEVESVDRFVKHASEDEAGQAGMHCVVWGDWSFEGKKFSSQDEAAEYFKQRKHTELAVIHYHGAKVVNRHMSKRLARVDWSKMKHWCDQHELGSVLAEETSPEASVHKYMTAFDHEATESLFDSSVRAFERSKKKAHVPKRPKHVPEFLEPSVSMPVDDTASFNSKASTLSGKVSIVDEELTMLSKKATALLKSIGVASKGASMLSRGHHSDSHGKLRARLASLENFGADVQEKTNLLETEMFGSTTVDKPSDPSKGPGRAVKAKVEALGMQAEELKSRLASLESSPLLGEVAKLEETTATLGSKAERIFTSIGIEKITAPVKLTDSNQPVKSRLSSLEGYAEGVQRNAAKLEYEILGNSWNMPTAGDSQATGSIKDHAASLGSKLQDLEARISALGNAPIVGDVSKMEDAVTTLFSRLTALSRNVGDNGKAPQEMALAQSSALKARIVALGGYIENMQSATATLEEELAGNVGTMPAQSRKDTLKSTARFMELQVENLNSRISALEQQV